MTDDKRAIISFYEDILSSDDLDRIGERVDESYTAPSGARGPAAFAANVRELRAGFPDLKYRVEDAVAEGDRIVVRFTWSATHRGTFRTHAPTGARVTSKGTAIHRMKDHKIVETWLELDRLGFLEQLGAVPRGLAGGPPASP